MYIFYNANPSGKSTGDCVIRAIATITGKSWVEVHEDLSFYSRKMYDMMDTNTVWHKYLKDLGFDIFAISDPWLTVDDFCKLHPYGRNSRMPIPGGMYSSERDSMGRYSSRGYSRDEAAYKMRSDLEMKLRNATDDNEREMIRRCLRSLDE